MCTSTAPGGSRRSWSSTLRLRLRLGPSRWGPGEPMMPDRRTRSVGVPVNLQVGGERLRHARSRDVVVVVVVVPVLSDVLARMGLHGLQADTFTDLVDALVESLQPPDEVDSAARRAQGLALGDAQPRHLVEALQNEAVEGVVVLHQWLPHLRKTVDPVP